MSYLQASLSLYIQALAGPTRFLDWLKYNIPLPGRHLGESFGEPKNDFYKTSLLWSWVFYLFGILIESLVIFMTIIFFMKDSPGQESFDVLLNSNANYIDGLKMTFFFNGLCAIFFPLVLLSSNFINYLLIRLMNYLFDQQLKSHEEIQHVVAISNSSYFFSCVPILGKMVQPIAQAILLYRSVRWRMGWSRSKSFFYLALPSIILFLFIWVIILLIIIVLQS